MRFYVGSAAGRLSGWFEWVVGKHDPLVRRLWT